MGAESRTTETIAWSGTPEQLERVTACLAAGGLVAFPTDTVYGLAAHAGSGDAIRALYAAKGRPKKKPLPILIGDPRDVVRVAREVPEPARLLAERFWPGPLTMVLPKSAAVADIVTAGRATVGVRVPDHPVARAILAACDFPLAVTSANLSGAGEPVTADGVAAQLGGRIDIIVDGGACPGGTPSTVIDFSRKPFRVLRAGPLSAEELLAALGNG